MVSNVPLSVRAASRPAVDTSYLDGLNAPQREAVLTTEGPVLVLAGAGTGKTRVLTTRLTHLLAQGLARPWEILSVTFTNKAAREMQHRIAGFIGDQVEGMRWLGTFHSIGAQILRRHAELVGLKSSFTIIDTDDQVRLAKDLISAEGLDEKRWTGRGMMSVIDRWKNAGWTPQDVPSEEGQFFANGAGIRLYEQYQQRLVTLNAADFGDLLLHNLTIFRAHNDVLQEYQRRFRYILVDEYQDTNVSQYLWLRLLAQRPDDTPTNICVVGDDDQSIYGWRGAEVENILRFDKDFEGTKVVRLEQNYRSQPTILAAADAIIGQNQRRLGKTLWTDIPKGENIRLRGVWDADEEARTTTDDIESERGRGRAFTDMAVLVRASFQMRSFEERFNAIGIPYKVVGGPRFYEREETRDALAYLRLVRNPDDDLSFARIVNKPRRGFGDKAMQMLNITARKMGISLAAACLRLLEADELKGRTRTAASSFLTDLARWRGFTEEEAPGPLAERILEEAGYMAYWQNSKNIQSATKLENLKELVSAAGEFDTLAGYLDHVSLVAERPPGAEEGGEVWLMTLHAAKGLEFPVVFLPGWEEEVFPSGRSIDEHGADGLEEERRLAYVGITRAREICTISFAANRQVYGRWQSAIPSRFVDELPEDAVDVLSEPGMYGTASRDLSSHSRFDISQSEPSEYDTPGYRRARRSNRSRTTPQTIDVKAIATSSAPGESEFSVGDAVEHARFGRGDVMAVEGNKLDVAFDTTGRKKVLASFLTSADD